ncbi:MAG: hypothetical protein EA361_14050, partial [Bacteroidetes bacterium]
LEGEQEIEFILDNQEAKFLKKIEEAERTASEIQSKLKKAIQRMLSKGFTLEEIAEDLEIAESEVKGILGD